MHIEPGYVASAKILAANIATVALLGSQSVHLLKRPQLIVRSLIAGVFFTLFMQAFHLRVGPSELHFLGAMSLYLAFGLLPALFGFALGLLAQGLIFEPTDLVHLGVNTLSLAVPLMLVHATLGTRLQAARACVRVVLRRHRARRARVHAAGAARHRPPPAQCRRALLLPAAGALSHDRQGLVCGRRPR